MSSKDKKKGNKFTFQSLIRLIIFIGLIYLIISFLSGQKLTQKEVYDPTVLGTEVASGSAQTNAPINLNSIYQKIPEDSRQKIENINKNPIILQIQDKFNQLKEQLNGFPEKQIKEIKISIVKNVSDDIIRSIEQK